MKTHFFVHIFLYKSASLMNQVLVLVHVIVIILFLGEWNKYGGVLLLGYELFRLLATVTPSMSSSKSMPSNRKKKSPASSDKTNGEPEVIDLDEEEKHMELLIGRL